MHERSHSAKAVAGLPTSILNAAETIIQRLSQASAVWHGRAMQGRATHAGGCFLAILIILGFFYGLSIQNPLKGVLIGTGIGILAALGTWLFDRRR